MKVSERFDMTGLSQKHSLLFPVLNILLGVFWAVLIIAMEHNVPDAVTFAASIAPMSYLLFGGLLAAYLTMTMHPELCVYFRERLVVLATSLIVFATLMLLMFTDLSYMIPHTLARRLAFLCLAAPVPIFLGEICYFAFRTKSLKYTAFLLLTDSMGWNIVMFLAFLAVEGNNI